MGQVEISMKLAWRGAAWNRSQLLFTLNSYEQCDLKKNMHIYQSDILKQNCEEI